MKHIPHCILLALAFWATGCTAPEQVGDPLAYVDPMIGTGGHGHTFPGATVPFGMVQLSPSNDYKNWDWCSGYHYSDTIIKGFAHTHISGPGLSGLGDILLMPAREPHAGPGTEAEPGTGYRARFSHDDETAAAGYYAVELRDEGVLAELTAGQRTGYHRYTFEPGKPAYLIIDPNHHINEHIQDTYLEWVSDREFRGYKAVEGWSAGQRRQHFYARFSKPVKSMTLTREGRAVAGRSGRGKGLVAQLDFGLENGGAVEVALALSSVSMEGAQANLEAEGTPGFDEARAKAEAQWREVLGKVTLFGASQEQLRVYYTGMYHAFISPNLISDADGQYYVEGEVRQSDIPQYSNFSTWDTYRALHPFFTIVEQEKTAAFVNSLSSRVVDAGVGLPSWECLGYDNRCMIGYSAVSPIADAVLKQVPGIGRDAAYEAIRYAAFDRTKHSQVSDLNGMDDYLKYGYVTAETGVSVSKTTEQNYCDWAIARVAEQMGKTKDQLLFDQRAIAYRNLFDPQTGYLMPRRRTGEMVRLDTSRWSPLKGHFISGNIWAYSAYTPHDMKGAMQLHGGRAAYAKWLKGVFENDAPLEGEQHVDISGFIGKYGHGDEPGHHMAYLFNYVGMPWLTQQYVAEVLRTMYKDTPDEGSINNEDLGQMSAWYLLSALGLYQVAPGDGVFQLGSPLHPKAVLHLESGKDFTVVAQGAPEHIYVQRVWLNGKPYEKNYLPYEAIMSGGELKFEMGPRPNREWGSAPAHTFPGDFADTAAAEVAPLGTPAPFEARGGAFFQVSREVVLDCAQAGARIYYTLDGSAPSEASELYQGPIRITEDAVLQAIAYSPGLNPSGIYAKPYFKSILADLPEGYPRFTVEQQGFPYGEEGGLQLFDQQIGSESYSDNKWTGIKDDIEVQLDLGEPRQAREVWVGALTETGSWIFPPSSIEVWAGSSPGQLSKVGELQLPAQEAGEKAVHRYRVPIEKGSYRYFTMKASNYGPTPAWHGAADGELWLFLDEIMIK